MLGPMLTHIKVFVCYTTTRSGKICGLLMARHASESFLRVCSDWLTAHAVTTPPQFDAWPSSCSCMGRKTKFPTTNILLLQKS